MKEGKVLIAVCDDSLEFLEQMRERLNRYQNETDIRAEKQYVQNPQELLNQPPDLWDVILLDIEMPGMMDGFQVAEALKAARCRAKIIFMTNHGEWWQSGYDLNAYHYLVKPCPYQKLARVLNRALHTLLYHESILLQQWNSPDAYRVLVEDIHHIKTLANGTKVYTDYLILTSSKNLSWWQTTYPEQFYKPHRSNLINLSFVHKLKGNTVEMQNGNTVPVAIRQTYKIQAALHSHIKTKSIYVEEE